MNFDPKSSILFLGSGFSAEATNIAGKRPPIGNKLRDQFAELLAVEGDYELRDLSDVIAKSPDHDLYQILYNNFTIRSLPESHRSILRQPWRRIYTTNYDDAVEWHFDDEKKSRLPNSYSYKEKTPRYLRSNDIVHLHGYIRKCTRENISEELILGHRSYVEERLKKSPWYDLFSGDLDNASSIFFVGYSLLDFNITAYLMRNPLLVKKTYFIIRKEPDEIFKTRVKPYGNISPIAVKGFAGWCSDIQPIEAISDPRKLRSFFYLNPDKDDKIYSKPTSSEIRDLMTLGHFNFSRLVSSQPSGNYVVQRKNSLEHAASLLEHSQTLVIHGYIGNGKTIFKNILALHLAKSGYHCFSYRQGTEIPESEFDYLRQSSVQFPPVIFFSSYDDFRSSIGQFSEMNENTRYVLEMDTGTFYVRQKELANASLGKLEKIDVNRLQNHDVEELMSLLDGAGILRKNEFALLRMNNAQFREYVLDLFNNSAVRKRIESIVEPLLKNAQFKKFLIASFVVRILGIDLSAVFLRNVTGVDPYDLLSLGVDSQDARDLFDFGESRVQPRSSVLVEFILKNLIDHDDIAKWISELGTYAAGIKDQELERNNIGSTRFQEANHLLGNIFKFSNLRKVFGEEASATDIILKLYEKGRRDIYINREPLFWLQFCIFQAQLTNMGPAEDYLNTAYDRASAIEGYRTYQLDTYALAFYMRVEEMASASSSLQRFGLIYEKIQQVREMVNDGNHRNFALDTLSKVESFIGKRVGGMQMHEKVQLTYEFNLIADRLERLPVEIKTQFATDKVKDSIIVAKNILVSHS